jgi:hypothetical protein
MKYLITLLLGLMVGGGGAIYFLGPSRAKSLPGARVQAPNPGGEAAGTAVITLDEKFFDAILGTIFRDLGSPSFQLAQVNAGPVVIERAAFQAGCTNNLTLLPEFSGVKTHVQFTSGKISTPIAFSGSYNLMGNCTQFKGWAQTNIQLSFDQSKQTVYGQVNVEEMNLEGVAPFANTFVTVFVQNAINSRVNPLELLRAPQLSPVVPVKASNGSVKTQVKDVRAEILDGSLRMHITYEFNGVRGEHTQG